MHIPLESLAIVPVDGMAETLQTTEAQVVAEVRPQPLNELLEAPLEMPVPFALMAGLAAAAFTLALGGIGKHRK